ncbi:YfgM family protein [Brackiella oedipodis]|uniref:YfgM family protein n=1 Tax=Brackiella oedipodis TaxID=124225 RepID=UPI00048D87C8|nr:tetratricopeptide repeat protein [Brackiella oedipodis]
MAFDLEEQEKIDTLKAWWERFGTLITSLIIIAALTVLARYGWDWYQKHKVEQALGYYEIVLEASEQSSDDAYKRLQEVSKTMQEDYSSVNYTGRALMIAARADLQQQNYDAAAAKLQWLVEHHKEFPELKAAATLQLATVLADQQKYDQALAQLKDAPQGLQTLYQDRQADIYFAKGDMEQAQQQWQAIVKDPHVDERFKNLVNLKLNIFKQ